MNIHQLNCFIAAAHHQSFSQAAKQIYISQPNLSKNIDNLENELGVKLFLRTNKGVKLTEEGKDLLHHASLIINQINDMTNYYHLRKERSKEIKISSQPISAVMNAISYSTKNNLTFQLIETNRSQVIEDVINNKSDLGFILTSSLDPLRFQDIFKDNHLQFKILKCNHCYVYLNKNHPLSHYKRLTFNDLSQYKRIFFNLDNITISFFKNQSPYGIITNSVSLAKKTLENTDHYLIQTSFDTDLFINENIIAIPLEEKNVKTEIGYCYKKTYQIDDLVKEYIDKVCYYLNE